MSETKEKEAGVKLQYKTPKLVEYGTVSKLTEAKSPGSSDGNSMISHNV